MRIPSLIASFAAVASVAAAAPYPTTAVQLSAYGVPSLDRPVSRFAIGPQNVAAILENGDIVVWGRGTTLNGLKHFAKPAKSVVLSAKRAYAVLEDSSLVGWGDVSWHWEIPADLGKVVEVSMSRTFVTTLRPDGSIRAWGDDSAYVQPPAGLKGLHGIQAWGGTYGITDKGWLVSVGGDSVHVVDSVGDVVSFQGAWLLRRNDTSIYFQGKRVANVVQLARGRRHSMALTSEGIVYAEGDTGLERTAIPASIQGRVKEIGADENFNLARLDDGRLVAWGRDTMQRNALPCIPTHATKVVTSGHQLAAILPDSTVATWGDYFTGPYPLPRGLDKVVDVALGYRFGVALRADGSLRAWGDSAVLARIALPEGPQSLKQVRTAFEAVVGLRNDGSVVIWKSSIGSALSIENPGADVHDLVTFDEYNGYAAVGIRNDGKVVAWKGGAVVDSLPKDLIGAKRVWVDDGYALALKADGELVGWGSAKAAREVPVDLGAVVDVSTYSNYAVAKRRDGTLKGWGTLPNGFDTISAKAGVVGAFVAGLYGIAFRTESTESVVRPVVQMMPKSVAGRRLALQGPGRLEILAADGRLLLVRDLPAGTTEIGAGIPEGMLFLRIGGERSASIRWLKLSDR